MSHHRDDGVYQVDRDSNLAPVLLLSTLSKNLTVATCQEILRVRPAEFIKLKQTKIWPCGRKALSRNSGTSCE